MKERILASLIALSSFVWMLGFIPRAQSQRTDGSGEVKLTGELKQWHKVTLTLDGPFARELDNDPNPFLDYRMTVRFVHESGAPNYQVPGYFAADGNAAHSSADSGTNWRAHLSPDKPGKWTWRISFVRGQSVAVNVQSAGAPVAGCDGKTGSFTVRPTDKSSRDLRAKGRLQYVGKHHLRFAETGEYFLKAGADAPETLLAYRDFDGTETGKAPLKSWEPHLRDWGPGDPTWKNGKGKGLIGALNYLSGKGCNAFSFLPYNAGGDGDNVWPFVHRDDKLHYDCSKLDQWQIVFDHAQKLGLYLHFKMQEQENDDGRLGQSEEQRVVAAALDGGGLGVERKLYCRELIARFAHALALNWNLGEENTQTAEQQQSMARYISENDPYKHHTVVHTFPGQQDKVYNRLVGNQSVLTGASLQNSWSAVHQRTLKWLNESNGAGRPWVVANDEQNPANLGVPPDPGYQGFEGKDPKGNPVHTIDDIRKLTLWGNLMAGGAGVEYYFGYDLPANDLLSEDWRSRDRSWEFCRIALDFFRENRVPFWEMKNANDLIGNRANDNSKYCFARPGAIYLVYLPQGGTAEIDLTGVRGNFNVHWFDPRNDGPLLAGSVKQIQGGGRLSLGNAPNHPDEDWLVVIRVSQERAAKPNVLLIVADDLGFAELGCQGNPEIPTPNIDSIAANGIRFTNAYASAPVCSPSRAGLLTGRYQTRFGHEFNVIGLQNRTEGIGLPLSEPTLPELLKTEGYVTGLVGKWHLGASKPYHPLNRGFEEFYGFLHEGHFYVPPPYSGVTSWFRVTSLPSSYGTRKQQENYIFSAHMGSTEPSYDEENPILRGWDPTEDSTYLTTILGREAQTFIDRHAGKPFFLYLSFNAPHSPMQAPLEYMKRFESISDVQRRIFVAMVASLDESVGGVLETLRRRGIEENTIVIFFSDNGGPTRELTSSNQPLRGGKGDLYEGGIRVPFLLQWKAAVPGGRIYVDPVITLDIVPTALAAAGVTGRLPKDLDGVNLAPYLRGKGEGAPHEFLYWRYGSKIALRSGKWKLVRNGTRTESPPTFELYDLSTDVSETNNLMTAQHEVFSRLRKQLEQINLQMVQPLWRARGSLPQENWPLNLMH